MRLWRNWQTRKTKDLVGDRAGSTPVNRTKPRIRAHLAPFLHVSDFGHLHHSKLHRPRIRKNIICYPSARFGALYFYFTETQKTEERLT